MKINLRSSVLFQLSAIISLFPTTVHAANECKVLRDELVCFSLLKDAGDHINGICETRQQGSQVDAKIIVHHLSPGSYTTSWVFIGNEPAARFDGTVADAGNGNPFSGYAVFTGNFKLPASASMVRFDVRDHERLLIDVLDDADLATELSLPRSNTIPPVSTGMGTCSFENNILIE